MQQATPALDRVGRERERLNALHDAIAIIVAAIGQKDLALRDAIVRQLPCHRAENDGGISTGRTGDETPLAGRACRAVRFYSGFRARAPAREVRRGFPTSASASAYRSRLRGGVESLPMAGPCDDTVGPAGLVAILGIADLQCACA